MRLRLHKITNVLTFRWFTGPILDKELRAASRRKRFYLMRSVYLLLLMLLMSLIWYEVIQGVNSISFRSSQLSEASKTIVMFIVWFQFIAAQILSVILCSTAINQEIDHRTLPVLMTTPITSLQIVMGKLISRLWQILVLLGVSLPLLAMLRVFGGIPWSFLLISLCITLSFAFFISAITLFFSMLFRRAYAVVIITIITLSLLFVAGGFIIYIGGQILDEIIPMQFWTFDFEDFAQYAIYITNPYALMAEITDNMLFMSSPQPTVLWIFQCGLLLLSGIVILSVSCKLVRKTALKHLVPIKTRKQYKVPPKTAKTYWFRRPLFLHSFIKHTVGTGMIWKEFLHPVLGKFRKVVFIGFILMVAAIVISFLTVLMFQSIEFFGFVVAGSVMGTIGLAILFTIVIPATYITSEKESGTWLILLTTCYSDTQIIGGKIIGVLRRICIVWIPFLLIYYIASNFTDNPVSTFFRISWALTIAISFVTLSGLYFSSRFKHSTTAVICNLALTGILWAGIPGILIMIEEYVYIPTGPFRFISNFGDDILSAYWALTPPGLIMGSMGDIHRSFRHWSVPFTFFVYTTIYILAMLLCYRRIKINLRKRIL